MRNKQNNQKTILQNHEREGSPSAFKHYPNNELPKTMRAAVATGFGEVDENIFVYHDWPVPELDLNETKTKKQSMLIRVLACALAPGDARILSGATSWIQLPKGGHPYVIGSDVAGIVMQVAPNEKKFKVGDYVISRFELPGPVGGVAEYRIVKTTLSEKCPDSIPPIISCGLSASSVAAKKIVQQHMKRGDRVMVIGGSGAVGSSVIQYAKLFGASFVAAVSTHKRLCEKLGADRVVDYQRENWWELPEFQTEERKFDIIFDLVNGDNWTKGAHSGKALYARKSKYVSLLSGVATEIYIQSAFDFIKVSFEWMLKAIITKINPTLPVWIMGDGLDLKEGELEGVLQDVLDGRLKPVLDPSSPLPFTEEGVRDAMKLQKSCHAQGKVVIEISDKMSITQ